jgi:hypothetical protein
MPVGFAPRDRTSDESGHDPVVGGTGIGEASDHPFSST